MQNTRQLKKKTINANTNQRDKHQVNKAVRTEDQKTNAKERTQAHGPMPPPPSHSSLPLTPFSSQAQLLPQPCPLPAPSCLLGRVCARACRRPCDLAQCKSGKVRGQGGRVGCLQFHAILYIKITLRVFTVLHQSIERNTHPLA